MITCIKDDDGRIISYMESWQVAQSGFQQLNGEYLWVNSLWVHKNYRNKGMILKMVKITLDKIPAIKYGYWIREKYNGRKSKLYSRERFQKLIDRSEVRNG